jgi:hypothetical protein
MKAVATDSTLSMLEPLIKWVLNPEKIDFDTQFVREEEGATLLDLVVADEDYARAKAAIGKWGS